MIYFKPILTVLCAFIVTAAATSANADMIVLHDYSLGEAGSISSNRAQDSVGGANFASGILGVVGTATPAPGSTAYMTLNGESHGNWGGNLSALQTDNFAVEIWARLDSTPTTYDVFNLGNNTNGSLKISAMASGNWSASLHNVAWIGASGGTGQTATVDAWTHLAVIRDAGVSTFYIDGVAQAGSTAGAPVHSASAHLGVTPNGGPGNWFSGDLDEMRIFTWDPGDDPTDHLSINAVPEPNSLCLMSLAMIGLVVRRKRN